MRSIHPAASSSSDKSKLTQAQWIQQAGTTLARAARAILSRESPPDALETLYSTCDDLVRLNDIDAGSSRACANLYDRIRLELERAVGQLRSKLSDRDLLATDTMTTTAAAAATWLTTLENEWNAVERDILLLRGVLLQLDRGFVLRSPDLLPIWCCSSPRSPFSGASKLTSVSRAQGSRAGHLAALVRRPRRHRAQALVVSAEPHQMRQVRVQCLFVAFD